MGQKKTKVVAKERLGQDWTLFSLKLLYLLALSALIYTTERATVSNVSQQLLVAEIVALIGQFLLLLFMFTPSLYPQIHWGVILGDALAVGAFAQITQADPVYTLALLGFVSLISMTRLGPLWGSVNLIVLAAVHALVIFYLNGWAQLESWVVSEWVSLAFLAAANMGIAILLYHREQGFVAEHTQLVTKAKEHQHLVSEIQVRTGAIAEMAQSLSSTLNYRRVLDAALNVGRLALTDRHNASFMAMVLLYRPEDRQLYLVNSLGTARADESRIASGRRGLINEALTLCEPVFTDTVKHDPELSHFVTLHRAKSIVVTPLRAGYDNYGVMIFASRERNAFNEDYRTFLEAIGIQTTIALQNAVLYQNLADEKERIVAVEEEARKKLARDLHDGPTQTIAGITMRLEIAKRMVRDDPAFSDLADELLRMEEMARRTTAEIRNMLFTLRPLSLESQGLNAALEQLAEKFDAVYDQKVEIFVSERAESVLSQHQSGTIFYIIEEAVNNARKHAKAEVIRARVTSYEDMVMVEILDNGVGFDVDKVTTNYEGRGSLGMVNLQERTELIDGTLTIESKRGRGTSITVLVPIDPTGSREKAKSRQEKSEEPRERFKLTAIR